MLYLLSSVSTLCRVHTMMRSLNDKWFRMYLSDTWMNVCMCVHVFSNLLTANVKLKYAYCVIYNLSSFCMLTFIQMPQSVDKLCYSFRWIFINVSWIEQNQWLQVTKLCLMLIGSSQIQIYSSWKNIAYWFMQNLYQVFFVFYFGYLSISL